MTRRAGGRRSPGWAAAPLVALVVLGGCGGGQEPSIARPPATGAGGPACAVAAGPAAAGGTLLPDLTLPCLAGGAPVPLRRITGAPTVINLWGTWCRPCREELPVFGRLHTAAGDRLRVVGIATQDRPGAARSYAADAGLPFPSLIDEQGDVLRGVGRRTMPVTVLVAADGTVVEVYTGAPLTDASLRVLVKQKLGVDVR